MPRDTTDTIQRGLRSPTARDPRTINIQMSLRMPFWRREQLDQIASELGVSTVNLIMDAVDRTYTPKPPK